MQGFHKAESLLLFFLNQFSPKVCQTYYYKNNTGNQGCQRCPEGKTNHTMHTGCKCKKNHYVGDDEDGPCYGMYPIIMYEKARVYLRYSLSTRRNRVFFSRFALNISFKHFSRHQRFVAKP